MTMSALDPGRPTRNPVNRGQCLTYAGSDAVGATVLGAGAGRARVAALVRSRVRRRVSRGERQTTTHEVQA